MEPTEDVRPYIEKDLIELQKRTQIIIDKKPIGKGGFAYVYSGTKDKRLIAIKVICTKGIPSNSQTKQLTWAKNELVVTGNLKNKNCIRCLGLFELDHSKMILLEYAPNKDMSFLTHMFYSGDLFKSVNIKEFKSPNSEFELKFNEKYKWFFFMSESFIRFFFLQILNALAYLKKMNFIHRDLKLDNLLLMKNFLVKLTDFALSTSIPSAGTFELSSAGTSIYMAPECLDSLKKEIEAKFAFRTDYFALGVILHKMLFNEFLVNTKDKEKKTVELKELNDKLDFISNKYLNYSAFTKRGEEYTSKDVQRVLLKLLHKDITKRADLSEIMSMNWVSVNEEQIKHLQDIYENDPVKLLLELQKIEYIDYYKNKPKMFLDDIFEEDMSYSEEYEIDKIKLLKRKQKKKKIFKIKKFKTKCKPGQRI